MQAAFFDIDGTLSTTTTMFRFREYLLAEAGQPAHVYHGERRLLAEMTAAGVPRAETCRVYYQSYAGTDARQVADLAEKWFQHELDSVGFFNPGVLAELGEHREAGRLVVLVSGSFRACLAPLARHVRADVLICSEPVVVDGRFTGEVDRAMIGEAKAAAVRELAARRGIDLAHSVAYGDHDSDLPLLRGTGTAVVVGDDAVMLEQAARHGWRQLPGPAAPAALTPYAPRSSS